MDTKRCKKCGIPLIIPQTTKWYGNGVCISRSGGQIVWFEANNLCFIFESLEKKLGVSLDKILIEATRQTSKNFTDELFGGWKKSFIKNTGGIIFPFARPLLNKFYVIYSQALGWGRVTPKGAKWRKEAFVRIENFYYPPFLGVAVGAFNSLWEAPVQIEMKEEGSVLDISIKVIKKEQAISSYLKLPKPPIIPDGNIKYELCSKCKAPLLVSQNFEWEWEKGVIFSKNSKKRWVAFGYDLSATFAALEQELGKKIPEMVMEIEKEYVVNNFLFPDLLKEGKDLYSNLFNPELWGILSWGNPVEVKKEEKSLKVRIDNPFSGPLAAGIVGGIYELINKRKANVQWTPNVDGYTIVTINEG